MIYTLFLRKKGRISQTWKQQLGSLIKSVARCTREKKSRAAMAIGALNKQEALFTSQLHLYLRNKPVHLVWQSALNTSEKRSEIS
jgi:hypothetical protein